MVIRLDHISTFDLSRSSVHAINANFMSMVCMFVCGGAARFPASMALLARNDILLPSGLFVAPFQPEVEVRLSPTSSLQVFVLLHVAGEAFDGVARLVSRRDHVMYVTCMSLSCSPFMVLHHLSRWNAFHAAISRSSMVGGDAVGGGLRVGIALHTG